MFEQKLKEDNLFIIKELEANEANLYNQYLDVFKTKKLEMKNKKEN